MIQPLLQSDGQSSLGVSVSPYALTIRVYKEVYARDKSPNKLKAIRELSYVYHMADVRSPYSAQPEPERMLTLKLDLFGAEAWEPDSKVADAIAHYRQTHETMNVKLLRSAQNAVYKLIGYFDQVDFAGDEEASKSAKELTATLGSIGKLVESLQTVADKVSSEQVGSVIRKGIQPNKFNS